MRALPLVLTRLLMSLLEMPVSSMFASDVVRRASKVVPAGLAMALLFRSIVSLVLACRRSAVNDPEQEGWAQWLCFHLVVR